MEVLLLPFLKPTEITPCQQTPQNQTPQDKQENLCKFCYLNEDESSQKLISPCGCSGSLKYVHKQCLLKWITAEAERKDAPLAPNFKLCSLDLKCKLCQKEIKFQKEIGQLSCFLTIFHIIQIIQYFKKLKYYACISIIGTLAMSYYLLKFILKKCSSFGSKVRNHTVVSLVILSVILVILEQTFVQIKWNSNNLEFSIPSFKDK